MSKSKSKAVKTAKPSTKAKTAGNKPAPGADVEKPLPTADQLRTAAEERLEETDQTMRADGTTARHTEPLGPPAPGQQGRPGPERRVRPENVEMTNEHPNAVGDTPEELAEYKASLGRVIRVRAKQTGFIDHVRRRAGDVFDVREGEFSKRWMQVVDGSTRPKSTGAQKAIAARNSVTATEKRGEAAARRGAASNRPTDANVLD